MFFNLWKEEKELVIRFPYKKCCFFKLALNITPNTTEASKFLCQFRRFTNHLSLFVSGFLLLHETEVH